MGKGHLKNPYPCMRSVGNVHSWEEFISWDGVIKTCRVCGKVVRQETREEPEFRKEIMKELNDIFFGRK